MTRAEFRRNWIQALRSGKYLQGRGALKNRGRYCCLGVACEVFGAVFGKGNDVITYKTLTEPSANALLPEMIAEKLGISPEGVFKIAMAEKFLSTLPATSKLKKLAEKYKGTIELELTTLNDEGVKFDEIADLLEACPRAFS